MDAELPNRYQQYHDHSTSGETERVTPIDEHLPQAVDDQVEIS